MTRAPEQMTDHELDTLLAHASQPPLPLGARERLLARMAAAAADAPVGANVVPLRRAAPAGSRLGWLAGLPVAASLALGIYLGSGGGLDAYLPSVAYGALADVSASDTLTGIEDMESFTEDDLS